MERRENTVHIRVTDEQKRILADKARRRGLTLSSWLLSLGLSQPDEPKA
ncbi:MAG: plasmid mobilization protein [bacterium]